MSAAFVTGLVAGYALALPVGPIAALLVSLSARSGLRVGAAAALGVATVDGLYALVAVVGGAALAPIVAPAATPLRWVGAAVLLALAARPVVGALRSAGAGTTPATFATPGRAYLGLLGLTALNPATIVYFVALVLGQRVALAGLGLAVFVGAVLLASASWQVTLAGGGALVGRLVTGPRGRLVTALVSSAVIAALAVLLVA